MRVACFTLFRTRCSLLRFIRGVSLGVSASETIELLACVLIISLLISSWTCYSMPAVRFGFERVFFP